MVNKLILVDIGNTFIKTNIDDKVFKHADHDILITKLHSCELRNKTLYVASVVPELTNVFISKAIGYKYKIINNDTNFSFKSYLNGIGVDRLLTVQGAIDENVSSVIVVDIGSAITIDIVHDNKLVDGLISPGLQLMLNSLGDYTSKLPKLNASITDMDFGTNTEDEIYSGVNNMMVSFIDYSISKAIQKYGDIFKIIVTGNKDCAEKYLNHSTYDFTFEKNLLFKGMIKIIKEGKV